jgi:hypothetical protein
MKTLKTIGAAILFTPGTFVLGMALWSFMPGIVIGIVCVGLAGCGWVLMGKDDANHS